MNLLLLIAIVAIGIVAVIGGIILTNPGLMGSTSTTTDGVEGETTTTTTTTMPTEFQPTTTIETPGGYVPTVS